MKKVTAKDLTLDKETVTNLSEEVNQATETQDKIKCITHNTCQSGCHQVSCPTLCQQATCPGYSDDPDTTCNATYQSVCMCITQNEGNCETRGCNPSKTQGPLCCELPEDSTPGGLCLYTEVRECDLPTVYNTCQQITTQDDCEVIKYSENADNADDCKILLSEVDNPCYSKGICIFETKSCDE